MDVSLPLLACAFLDPRGVEGHDLAVSRGPRRGVITDVGFVVAGTSTVLTTIPVAFMIGLAPSRFWRPRRLQDPDCREVSLQPHVQPGLSATAMRRSRDTRPG